MATIKQVKDVKRLENNSLGYGGNYVYLIKCHEFYKIGIANDIDARLNSLQCGNPYELELMFAMRYPNAEDIEEMLHERYGKKRVFREWFRLDADDIVFIRKIME
jgi:hypothetical protein